MNLLEEMSIHKILKNVWSYLKRGIEGVYREVSLKHLQKYANEFALSYNHRDSENMFEKLLTRIR